MTEREISRNAARRLAIIRHAQEVSGNVALTCRYYGVTRPSYYKWLRRYVELGVDGLRDRSRRPRESPNATKRAAVDRIIYLRQHYHFGPLKIAITWSGITASASASRGSGASCAAWTSAGYLAHIATSAIRSAGSVTRSSARASQFRSTSSSSSLSRRAQEALPVHRHPRLHALRVLKIYGQLNQKTAIQFADYVLEKFPFRVEQIQTDNDSEFQSAFHWHLLDRGLRHIYIRPATPRLNGKVERSHRIDDEEFYRMLAGEVIATPRSSTASSRSGSTITISSGLTGARWSAYERLRQATLASV